MKAPNRAAEVRALLARLPPAQETTEDTARRANLYEVITELNAVDGGEWGALTKLDQGGKVPADIVVWRSTMEHFDVLSGETAVATWQPRGIVTDPNWRWLQVSAGSAAPGAPPPAESEAETLARLGPDVRQALSRLEAAQDTVRGGVVPGDPPRLARLEASVARLEALVQRLAAEMPATGTLTIPAGDSTKARKATLTFSPKPVSRTRRRNARPRRSIR